MSPFSRAMGTGTDVGGRDPCDGAYGADVVYLDRSAARDFVHVLHCFWHRVHGVRIVSRFRGDERVAADSRRTQ